MVPTIEVIARKIKRKMVRLTEQKKFQMRFELFVVLDAAISQIDKKRSHLKPESPYPSVEYKPHSDST